jgi:hypothetical protein
MGVLTPHLGPLPVKGRGSATDAETMTKALSALGCRERSMAQTYRARLSADAW